MSLDDKVAVDVAYSFCAVVVFRPPIVLRDNVNGVFAFCERRSQEQKTLGVIFDDVVVVHFKRLMRVVVDEVNADRRIVACYLQFIALKEEHFVSRDKLVGRVGRVVVHVVEYQFVFCRVDDLYFGVVGIRYKFRPLSEVERYGVIVGVEILMRGVECTFDGRFSGEVSRIDRSAVGQLVSHLGEELVDT